MKWSVVALLVVALLATSSVFADEAPAHKKFHGGKRGGYHAGGHGGHGGRNADYAAHFAKKTQNTDGSVEPHGRHTEVDKTAVVVAESSSPKAVDEFYVKVVHIEDDVDDETGQVDAERVTVVALKFDVMPDLTVTVNGEPVQVGYSKLDIKAAVISAGLVEKLHDLKMLAVQVFVAIDEQIDSQGLKFYSVLIQERVIEVEDDKVWQAVVRQQVIDVYQDGKLIEKGEVVEIQEVMSKLPTADISSANAESDSDEDDSENVHPHAHHDHDHDDDDNEGEAKSELKKACKKLRAKIHKWLHAVKEWYHGLPFVVRIIVAFAVGMVAGFIALSFFSCIARCFGFKCCNKKCSKQATSTYEDNLRMYAADYTAVPVDEKAAEKKEKQAVAAETESGSIEMV